MSEKLTIKDETAAIDMGAKDLWASFTDDQKKQISFYLLLRYASSIKTSDKDLQALTIFKTNEYYNKHFFSLSKHPQLLWYLLCMCGNDEKNLYFHEWISTKKKDGTKIHKALQLFYPHLKDDEIDVLAKITEKSEIKEHAKTLGMTDDEIKKLI